MCYLCSMNLLSPLFIHLGSSLVAEDAYDWTLQVQSIVGTLLEALPTPSYSVQEAVSDCLAPLMSGLATDKSYVQSLAQRLLDATLSGPDYPHRYCIASARLPCCLLSPSVPATVVQLSADDRLVCSFSELLQPIVNREDASFTTVRTCDAYLNQTYEDPLSHVLKLPHNVFVLFNLCH